MSQSILNKNYIGTEVDVYKEKSRIQIMRRINYLESKSQVSSDQEEIERLNCEVNALERFLSPPRKKKQKKRFMYPDTDNQILEKKKVLNICDYRVQSKHPPLNSAIQVFRKNEQRSFFRKNVKRSRFDRLNLNSRLVQYPKRQGVFENKSKAKSHHHRRKLKNLLKFRTLDILACIIVSSACLWFLVSRSSISYNILNIENPTAVAWGVEISICIISIWNALDTSKYIKRLLFSFCTFQLLVICISSLLSFINVNNQHKSSKDLNLKKIEILQNQHKRRLKLYNKAQSASDQMEASLKDKASISKKKNVYSDPKNGSIKIQADLSSILKSDVKDLSDLSNTLGLSELELSLVKLQKTRDSPFYPSLIKMIAIALLTIMALFFNIYSSSRLVNTFHKPTP